MTKTFPQGGFVFQEITFISIGTEDWKAQNKIPYKSLTSKSPDTDIMECVWRPVNI